MSSKVDKDFLKFVKTKKKKTTEHQSEDSELGDNDERLNKPFNNLKSNDINKEDSNDICDLLRKNKGKVFVEKRIKPSKEKSKNTGINQESEEEEESESESDDYENEKINHYVNKKRIRDDDADEESEVIKEMKKYEMPQEFEEEEEEDEKSKDKQLNSKEETINTKKQTNKFKPLQTNTNNTIFIGNLPDDITEESLKTKFSKFGIIKKIRIKLTQKKSNKNFAYIDFETEKAMTNACNAKIKIKNSLVKVEKAKSSFITEDEDNQNRKRIGKKKQRSMLNKEKDEFSKMKKKEEDFREAYEEENED